MNTLLWVVLPYATLLTVVLGTILRYRYDKFGWTTRSSQLYESTVLRWGSPMFHIGILFVLLGHIGGLLFGVLTARLFEFGNRSVSAEAAV